MYWLGSRVLVMTEGDTDVWDSVGKNVPSTNSKGASGWASGLVGRLPRKQGNLGSIPNTPNVRVVEHAWEVEAGGSANSDKMREPVLPLPP